MYEYSTKGLPHAVMHASDLVKTFGHHGACCTCAGEAAHRMDIKHPGQRARVYADKNATQASMLERVHDDELWSAVVDKNSEDDQVDARDAEESTPPPVPFCELHEDLHFADTWFEMVPNARGRPPPMWGSTFLSSKVLLTRNELLTLLRSKLEMQPTWHNINRLARETKIQCFGMTTLSIDGTKRRIVGTSTSRPARRDFVRLNGTVNDTALSVQVICFVRVSGLDVAGISVPDTLTQPENETCNAYEVTLVLVRWLSPDSRCLLRDSGSLPLCPPPFGSNHALWAFTKLRLQRGYFSDHLFARQLHLFPGKDRRDKRRNARDQSHARYDFITLESIQNHMNYTFIDNDNNSIMESVTLPFGIL